MMAQSTGALALGWFLVLAGTATGQVVVDMGDRTLIVGATEVTQGLYQRVTGENPSAAQGDDLPVDSVSWTDAVAFCNALSLVDGLEPVYGPTGADRTKSGWRLPTAAEWEVLARAEGSETLTETAWFANNAERRTHPVGTLRSLRQRLGMVRLRPRRRPTDRSRRRLSE